MILQADNSLPVYLDLTDGPCSTKHTAVWHHFLKLKLPIQTQNFKAHALTPSLDALKNVVISSSRSLRAESCPRGNIIGALMVWRRFLAISGNVVQLNACRRSQTTTKTCGLLSLSVQIRGGITSTVRKKPSWCAPSVLGNTRM